MSTPIRLPQQTVPRRWRGVFEGRYDGDLWQTFNIDLERVKGKIVLSDKARILVDSDTDIASMGVPLKFVRSNARDTDNWYALTTTKILKNGNTSPTGGTWTSDTDVSNSPANPRDMAVFEGFDGDSDGVREDRLIVSLDTNVAVLNVSGSPLAWRTTWWTDTTAGGLSQSSLAAGVPHPLGKLQRLLALGDRDSDGVGVIHTVDRSDTVSSRRIRFPKGFQPRLTLSTSTSFFFLCQNDFGGNGKAFEWDGSSNDYAHEYEILGQYPLCGWVHNDTPYIVTELGYILKFTGAGFKEVQTFPFREEQLELSARAYTAGGATTAPADSVTEYGAYVEGNIVKILIGSPTTSRRMRAGIWIFDLVSNNLYHKTAIGQHKAAGTDIDYGQGVLAGVGGLAQTKAGSTEFVAGASVYTNYSGSTKTVIARGIQNTSRGSNAGRNRGHFITTWIQAPEILSQWLGMWLKFRTFLSGSNSIVVKHRTKAPRMDQNDNDESVLQATGNWRNDTSFVVAVPTGVVVGDEVEILAGKNAGSTFHINTITDTNGAAATPDGSTNMIVSIDEAVGSSNDTTGALFRFDNWVKDGQITDTATPVEFTTFTGSDSNSNVLNVSDEVQIKVELRGFSQEIREIDIQNNTTQEIIN